MGDAVQSHWFGLPVPDKVKPVRAWGARMIIRQDSTRQPVKKRGRIVGYDTKLKTIIESVMDRSQYRGPNIEEPEAKAFFKWLDKTALPELRKVADKMGLGPADDVEVKVDQDDYHLRANPRRSYGYLYVVAWEG